MSVLRDVLLHLDAICDGLETFDFFENIATNIEIAHPTQAIIFYFCFFYFGLGINIADREQHISSIVIPPLLQKILFLNCYSQYTLNTIIVQIIIVSSTILSLLLLLVPGINRSNVVVVHNLIMIILMLVQSIFLVRAELSKKKRKHQNK